MSADDLRRGENQRRVEARIKREKLADGEGPLPRVRPFPRQPAGDPHGIARSAFEDTRGGAVA